MSLLSFFGGAAKGFVESVEKEEERAREDAKGAITALYKNYQTVTEENRKLENTLNEDRQLFEATFGKAEKDQLEAILYNRPVAEMIRKGIESGKINKDTFDLNQFVTVAKANPEMAAKTERTQQLISLPETVQKIREQYANQPGGLRGFIKSFGEKEYIAAEQAYANRTGRTLEELKGAKRLELKAPAGAEYNMGMFADKKSFTQREDDAKNALLDAQASGDEAKLTSAKANMKAIQTVKDQMTPEQTKFANRIADIKNRFMFGTPQERAAAKPEYDKMLADVRAEAAARKAGEGKEDKIPTLGTLNAFTSAAVARRVAEVHGELIRSKQLAIIEKPDGSSSLEYTGDNPEIRKQINNTAYGAAQNALSLYMLPNGEPMTRDVAAVLNTYVPQSVMRQPPPTPTATPAPAAAPRPAPSANIAALRREAEAAIANGANRDAVAKRFKDRTGQEF